MNTVKTPWVGGGALLFQRELCWEHVSVWVRLLSLLVWNSLGGLGIYYLNIKYTLPFPKAQLRWRRASCFGTEEGRVGSPGLGGSEHLPNI